MNVVILVTVKINILIQYLRMKYSFNCLPELFSTKKIRYDVNFPYPFVGIDFVVLENSQSIDFRSNFIMDTTHNSKQNIVNIVGETKRGGRSCST